MPPSAKQLLCDAGRLLQGGRPQVAALVLAAAEARGADLLCVASGLARASLDQGRSAEALGQLARVGQHAHRHPGLLMLRAEALLAAGDPVEACDDAAAAMRLEASAPAVLLHATALMRSGRIAEAALLLDGAIHLAGVGAGLHVALAVALLGLGEIAAAEQAVARGLAIYPDDRDLLRLARVRETTT